MASLVGSSAHVKLRQKRESSRVRREQKNVRMAAGENERERDRF